MAKNIWLAAIAVLHAGVCFGDPIPGVNINVNINIDGKAESIDGGAYGGGDGGGNGGGGGCGGGPPTGLFGQTPDGWKPPSNDPCPDPIQVKQNFTLNKYLGLWYEIERMYNPFTFGDCVTAHYSLKEDGNVRVINSNGKNLTTDDTIVGTAVPYGTEGRLTVSFPPTECGYQGPPPTGPNYNILMTDYDNFAVVYTCDSFQIPGAPVQTKLEFGWILSRTAIMPEASLLKIKKDLQFLNYDTERFNPTNQDGCQRLQHDFL